MKLSIKNAIYQAIIHSKWLGISYVNKKEESTDYYIGIKDINTDKGIIVCDIFNPFKSNQVIDGSKKTAALDRQKEEACKRYGAKLIRIPNSAIKDYESIISLFEF